MVRLHQSQNPVWHVINEIDFTTDKITSETQNSCKLQKMKSQLATWFPSSRNKNMI